MEQFTRSNIPVLSTVKGTVTKISKKLSKQLSGHRSAIKKHANTFIPKHFNQPGHSVADILIQPIEKIELLPGKSDEDVTIRRLDRERFWMLELGTVYPYGLNDRLQSVGNVSKKLKNNINVFSLLNKHKTRKRSHGRRRNKVSRSKITLENLYSIFNKEHCCWWTSFLIFYQNCLYTN